MAQDTVSIPSYNELMMDFEDAVLKQRLSSPGSRLSDLKEKRFQSRIQHRLTELEGKYLFIQKSIILWNDYWPYVVASFQCQFPFFYLYVSAAAVVLAEGKVSLIVNSELTLCLVWLYLIRVIEFSLGSC